MIQPYLRKPHYYETDQTGIIHHANYIRWFEEARVDFLDRIGFGYGKVTESGIDILLLGVECEYRSMVRFGDTVKILLTIPGMGQAKMTVVYRIEDAVTGELRTTGITRHCFYDREAKRPVSLKKSLPELYALLEVYTHAG
jgi:acyl-CoA thioester hydrolase